MEKGALTPESPIEWSIEVEADDRQAAARLALAIQQCANRSMSGVFDVWDTHDPDDPAIVGRYPESLTPLPET